MTTEIIVKAHCGSDKEVSIQIMDGETPVEGEVIQDGEESTANYVYDNRSIVVREVDKG